MWEIIGLVSLIIFQDEAALVHFYNRGFPLFWTFFILSASEIPMTLLIYYVFGWRVLVKRIHFPQKMITWLYQRKMVQSYLHFRQDSEEKEKRFRRKIIKLILKTIDALGYAGLAMATIVPIPTFKVGAILAARIGRLKYGIYVIIAVAELKLLFETIVMYHFGETIPFVHKIVLWHLVAIFIGGSLVYVLFGWFRHAVNHHNSNHHS
ncbi:MAG: hypothetical protein WC528_05225 [Patescibacteria group bacterium]